MHLFFAEQMLAKNRLILDERENDARRRLRSAAQPKSNRADGLYAEVRRKLHARPADLFEGRVKSLRDLVFAYHLCHIVILGHGNYSVKSFALNADMRSAEA